MRPILISVVSVVVGMTGCEKVPQVGGVQERVYLDQGWSHEDRTWFHHAPQGSWLLPYTWFLSLEQPGSEKLFRDDDHMESFRYIPDQVGPANPDGLPIGFARDGNAENPMLGLTCAACHTGQINYRGKAVLIEGGPAMAEFTHFLKTFVEALVLTQFDPLKFNRFAERVLGENSKDTQAREKLRSDLLGYIEYFVELGWRNAPDLAWGFGRLDALTGLTNDIVAAALHEKANYRRPNAPVSYPHIWNASHRDWVQWNASIFPHVPRNVGEVLGTFGQLTLTGDEADWFESSVNIEALFELESRIATLKAPLWPEEIFGRIDREKARRGEQHFNRYCAGCHEVRWKRYSDPAFVYQDIDLIAITKIPVAEVGTDPQTALSFAARTAETGELGKRYGLPAEMLAAGFISFITGEVQKKYFADHGIDEETQKKWQNYRRPGVLPPDLPEGLKVYAARPLNGIWATAPFLHNGSVPNLYQLLLPASQRARTFHVGSREFDPRHLGFKTDPFEGGFEFRTDLPGNSNAGHEHGNQLQESQRWELLEYIKSLPAIELRTGT